VRGGKTRTRTTLRFKLRGNAVVEFTVVQVSPLCRVVGHFTVRGHRGVNKVPFDGRVQGSQLSPGTYRIVARTRSGATVFRSTLVLVEARAPTKSELARARRSNVCDAAGTFGTLGIGGSFAGATGGGTQGGALASSTIVRNQRQSANGSGNNDNGAAAGDDLGRPIAQALSRAAENAANPVVIALLGLAFLVFGLAALPRTAIPDPRTMALVASHRLELAMAGTAALGAAVVAMFLS
jgi:hypothetical protein